MRGFLIVSPEGLEEVRITRSPEGKTTVWTHSVEHYARSHYGAQCELTFLDDDDCEAIARLAVSCAGADEKEEDGGGSDS